MTGFPSTMMDSLPKSALHAKAFSFEEVIMVERPLNLLLVFLTEVVTLSVAECSVHLG